MQPVRVYKEFLPSTQSRCVGPCGLHVYPSSGLFPWPITGMLKVRTRWVISSSVAPECLVKS
jgi:hypothetical protein